MNTISGTPVPTRTEGWPLLIGVVVFVVAACSASVGATTNPAANTAPAGATAVAGQPTEAAAATAAGGGGGGGTASACDLVTTAEMATAIGSGTLTAEPDPGPPPGCGYRLAGTPVAALVLTASGGEVSFDAMAADASSVAVPGIGDKALYNEPAHELLILKGGKLLAVVVTLAPDKLPGSAAAVYQQIAAIAAGRL